VRRAEGRQMYWAKYLAPDFRNLKGWEIAADQFKLSIDWIQCCFVRGFPMGY